MPFWRALLAAVRPPIRTGYASDLIPAFSSRAWVGNRCRLETLSVEGVAVRAAFCEGPDDDGNGIHATYVPGRDKLVPAPKFGAVCRLLWPHKTAAHLAAIAGRDERTAKRWLAGEYEPPVAVLVAVINKMFER